MLVLRIFSAVDTEVSDSMIPFPPMMGKTV